MMHYFSPAKINLFLHITSVRTDGYHNLQSVFRTLDFGDYLDFECTKSDQLIKLSGANHLTTHLDDNLIVKAAHALVKKRSKYIKPIHITLHKHIPTGAGLGGGSSNCATTLIALNRLWRLNLSTDELINIGAKLGADVPFFIFAHTYGADAIATSIGDVLSPITLPQRSYLLLMPNTQLATAQFFTHPNLTKNTPIIDNPSSWCQSFERQLIEPFHNCFELIAIKENPAVKDALYYLHSLPSQSTPRMTGTGSAVFLPLNIENLEQAAKWQHNAPCRAIICRSLYGVSE